MLGDVCEIARGGSPRPIEKYITNDISGINWIKIGDTSGESMFITKTAQKIIPEGMKKSRFVQPGDFLLSNSMSFGRPYISKIDGCIHDGWLLLRDKNDSFNKEYLYYVLSSNAIKAQFKSLAVGGVVNNLNTTVVKQVRIPLPPLETQRKIAKTLDTVSELLAMRKQQLAELDNLIKSTFYDMFGDPVTNEKGWTVSTLGRCCDLIKDGPHVSPNYVEEGIPFVSVNNIIKGHWDLDNVRYISKDDYEKYSKRCKPELGDVLYTKGGTTGYAKYVDRKFEFMNWVHIALLKQKRELLNGLFLETMLNLDYCYTQSQRFTRGIANRDLVLSQIAKICLFIPPIEKQDQFSEIVTNIKEQIATVNKAIEETQYFFDSLMSQYFD